MVVSWSVLGGGGQQRSGGAVGQFLNVSAEGVQYHRTPGGKKRGQSSVGCMMVMTGSPLSPPPIC
ncbi:hypothetical protein, partial [Xanthomonas citri]|uniref:hypothetical protein n=1 Tax=Xanthomonas citri TaxID=346 RepID=UPI001F15F62E